MFEWLWNRYLQAINSIAFYPFIISSLFVSVSITIVTIGTGTTDEWLRNLVPIFDKSNPETARTLLSVLITGMFTLTVFSFSMVMVVLNQAANNYSPKVLDGLLKDKRPQFILGFYIGSLLFCLPLLLNLTDSQAEKSVSVTGVFLALLCAIIDLFVFIRFIDYVSRSVKPAEISRSIYKRTFERWKERNSSKRQASYLDEEGEYKESFTHYFAVKSGYYQGLDEAKLLDWCTEKDWMLKVEVRVGDYVLEGTPFFSISGGKPNDSELKKLHQLFFFYNIEDIENNLFYGYRQLTEVAAKALSPGINDIGTARICIDFLTDLISLFAQNPMPYGMKDKEGQPRVIYQPIDLHDIFELCLDEIRLCGRGDKNIMDALLHTCALLFQHCEENSSLKKEVVRFSQKLYDDLQSGTYLDDTAYLLNFYRQNLKPHLGNV